jgi:hypothetical protein
VLDEVLLMGQILLEVGDPRRRARIAFHLCLERATTVEGLLRYLDHLAVWLMGHGDDAAGNLLLARADDLREELYR